MRRLSREVNVGDTSEVAPIKSPQSNKSGGRSSKWSDYFKPEEPV